MKIDDYVLDVLMRDLAGHDHAPSAYLVYLHLWSQTMGRRVKTARLSHQAIADEMLPAFPKALCRSECGACCGGTWFASTGIRRQPFLSTGLPGPGSTASMVARFPSRTREQA
jgi:hypothetical protein